jgi:hypothetical protein
MPLHSNEPIIYGIPILTLVPQNHDNEPNITHLDEILREQNMAPLSYTRRAPPEIGGEGGPGTYWVPVRMILYQYLRCCKYFLPFRSMNMFMVRQTRVSAYLSLVRSILTLDRVPVLILWFFDSRGTSYPLRLHR